MNLNFDHFNLDLDLVPDLIGTAYAQDAAPGAGAAMGNILFMAVLFAVFYFLLIRPQQKQAKQHKEMVANLTRGDSVVTGGGLLGRVHRVEEELAVVEIGEVEVAAKSFKPLRVKIRKSTITTVTAKAGVSEPEPKKS